MPVLFAASVVLVVLVAGCAPARIDAPPASPTVAVAGGTPTPRSQGRTRGLRPARTPLPIPTYGPAPSVVASLDDLFGGVLPDPDTDYGMVVEDLTSGARAAVNDGQVFPSASLYKLGVAWMVLRRVDAGAMSLDDPLEIDEADTVEPEPDSGVAVGDRPTVREALESMLSISSNAMAHAFLRTLGRAAFNQEMQRIGLGQTRVPEDAATDAPDDSDAPGGSAAEALAVTSAADIAHLLRLLVTSQQLTPASRTTLSECLATSNPPDALRETLPDTLDILDKTGNLDDASNVGALLRSSRGMLILVVLDHGVDPGDARGVIAHAGQIAYTALLQDSAETHP